jgi:prophage antirepressor-like protein
MNIIPFEFNAQEVRSVIGDNGEPLFNAKDVCEILGISKYRDAVKYLDEDERVSIKVDTLGGKQEMIFVDESGLYHLIFKAYKPEAQAFRRWVTKEVLPSIRKTGSYSLGGVIDQSRFYETYKRLNPNTKIEIEFESIKAQAYEDATHGYLITSVELAKLMRKSPSTIRVLKKYHGDIMKENEHYCVFERTTYWTQKGVSVVSLHSRDLSFGKHIHAIDAHENRLIL